MAVSLPEHEAEGSGVELPEGPELFFGIVSPLGVPWREVAAALGRSLDRYGYKTDLIQLSKLLTPRYEGAREDDRVVHYIGCGNRICREEGTHDAIARLGVADIHDRRV